MSAIMVGQRPKIWKKKLAKTPYNSPATSPPPPPPPPKKKKKGGGAKYKWFDISFLEFFFFWKYYFTHFRHYFKHLYLPTRSSVHHQNFFIILDFLASKPTKTSKKDDSFYNRVSLKNLIHFTNLNSLDIENNMLRRHNQKPLWLYKVCSKHVSVWCQKKHLPCTISGRARTAFLKHFENKCLYISVHLHEKLLL